MGYSIEQENWDIETERAIRGRINKYGQTARDINNEIENGIDEIDRIISEYWKLKNRYPTADELRRDFYVAMGRAKEKPKDDQEKSFFQVLEAFKSSEGKKNSWTDDTYEKFTQLGKHLKAFDKSISFDKLSEEYLINYIEFLQRKLRFRNTTTQKHIKFLRWFIKWSHNHGYYPGKIHEIFRPRFKGTDGSGKEIVYLEWDELMQLYNYEYPADKLHLDRARDVFCFCCFTGLRYSDVQKLSKFDVFSDHIRVVTQKTVDGIKIELNKYSSAILKKYQDSNPFNDKALPVPSNQKMNDYIKDACKLAQINRIHREVYFIGSERFEEVNPIYEIISTHAARRTFVVIALYLGISESVIIEWTGHSDYDSLKPYKKIVNNLKAKEMGKFDIGPEKVPKTPEKSEGQ